MLGGLEGLGVLARSTAWCPALSATRSGAVVAEAVEKIIAAHPGALYACDPVMGDRAGLFVRPGVARHSFQGAAAAPGPTSRCRISTSFGWLTEAELATRADVLAAIAALRRAGPKLVVATGIQHAGLADGEIETIAADADGAWSVATPFLPGAPTAGTGDCFAALFFGHYLPGRDLASALSRAPRRCSRSSSRPRPRGARSSPSSPPRIASSSRRPASAPAGSADAAHARRSR